ncbi:MAG: efflux RND transporter periplasmic adaptor subunit [Bryobacteraceae bacterium]|nr:efflux RND transporter periplasmic adaptor subunit [Bryobacteraceae bacterium]
MRWKRWVLWIVILAVVVGLIVWAYRPQPQLVDVTTAERGPMQVTVEEEGKTRVVDRFVVYAPVTGFARRIQLRVGDAVRQGQTVARIEPMRAPSLDPRARAEAQARVEAAQAALAAARERVRAAESDVAYWKGEMARVQQLMKSGDIARAQYDRASNEEQRAEAALSAAQYSVRQAEAELEAARALLRVTSETRPHNPADVTDVRAPVSGRVLRLVRESEGVVNAGEPLIELANATSLEVVVEVLSADAVKIAPGTRVLFERWGGEAPLEGRVRRIEPVAFTKLSALGVEEQRVLVIADIVSPPELWQRLGDQYRVEARFILWESQDVLRIPASALFRFEDGWAVFVVENGVARRRRVEIGRRSGLTAEVLGGLEPGEQVIPHPDDRLTDGLTVTPAHGA